MQSEIEIKSRELKQFVSNYDSSIFLGELSSLMHWIGTDSSTLNGLSSPQKQLFYIAALNITSMPQKGRQKDGRFSDEDWIIIKNYLNAIEQAYDKLFDPKEGEIITEEWLEKRKIALPAFNTYYYQGLINYDEQIIERVESYFTPFNNEIESKYGLSVRDFIEIYNWVDSLTNKYWEEKLNPQKEEKSWNHFIEDMKSKNLMPWEWQDHLPESEKNFMEFMSDKGRVSRFSTDDITPVFGKEKSEAFLNVFTCTRKEEDFLYFTEDNPLLLCPIFKIDEKNYQAFELKYLILAVYNVLTKFCLSNVKIKDRFTKHRGSQLERKIEDLFRNFLTQEAKIHRSFYTDVEGEQDLLIVEKGVAFIIEAKATKQDAPRRDPERAYPILVQDFTAAIQKGYDQCYRVMKKFITQKPLPIFEDERRKKKVLDIRTKNYHAAFSIVVTLERFGNLQMDLSGMLEIYDDDEFPWSVSIDDLEIILLVMKKEGLKSQDLINFLKARQQLQGRIFVHDEAEIAGFFIKNGVDNNRINEGAIIRIPPGAGNIYDDYYNYKGIGFRNEKNLEKKTSGKYLVLG